MTVILVVLTMCIFLGVDWLVHKEKWGVKAVMPEDVMFDSEVGFTMADGGSDIKNKNEDKKENK